MKTKLSDDTSYKMNSFSMCSCDLCFAGTVTGDDRAAAGKFSTLIVDRFLRPFRLPDEIQRLMRDVLSRHDFP
jgi:hypothetical protein